MSRVPVKATRQVRPDEGETNDTRWAAIHYGSAGTPVGLRPALSLARKAKTVQSDYAMPVHPGNVGQDGDAAFDLMSRNINSASSIATINPTGMRKPLQAASRTSRKRHVYVRTGNLTFI